MKSKVQLPRKDAIFKSMKVGASSVAGANYVAERLTKIFTQAKMLDTCKDMLDLVKKYVFLVECEKNPVGQIWLGNLKDFNDQQTMHDNSATAAAKDLSGQFTKLNLDYSIDKDGQLLRGFSNNGEQVSEQQCDKLDEVVSAWLTIHANAAIKGGVLVKRDGKGEIMTDEKGQPVKADRDEIVRLMNDSDKGIVKFMKDKGLEMSIQDHSYPGEQPKIDKTNELEMEVKAGAYETTVQPKVTPAEAEEPQPGMKTRG